jgi:hypothetical protein
VPPNARLPFDQPATAQAFEFSKPAVAGLGEKPVPVMAEPGFVPTDDCVALLKSMTAEALPLESCNCAETTVLQDREMPTTQASLRARDKLVERSFMRIIKITNAKIEKNCYARIRIKLF